MSRAVSRDAATALDELQPELNHAGSAVVTVAADTGIETDVRRMAQNALEQFGGSDT